MHAYLVLSALEIHLDGSLGVYLLLGLEDKGFFLMYFFFFLLRPRC